MILPCTIWQWLEVQHEPHRRSGKLNVFNLIIILILIIKKVGILSQQTEIGGYPNSKSHFFQLTKTVKHATNSQLGAGGQAVWDKIQTFAFFSFLMAPLNRILILNWLPLPRHHDQTSPNSARFQSPEDLKIFQLILLNCCQRCHHHNHHHHQCQYLVGLERFQLFSLVVMIIITATLIILITPSSESSPLSSSSSSCHPYHHNHCHHHDWQLTQNLERDLSGRWLSDSVLGVAHVNSRVVTCHLFCWWLSWWCFNYKFVDP